MIYQFFAGETPFKSQFNNDLQTIDNIIKDKVINYSV